MLRTSWAWPAGGLNTALWGSLSLAGSMIDPSGRWAHACMVRWARINLSLMGTRVEVGGLENIDPTRPQVLIANHQSMADILVLASVLPVSFRFVAKRELFDIPFLGWHMRRAGFIPIERRQRTRAARTLLEAATRIRGGVNALVFPEGTRSEDGRLLPFQGGAFLLALRAGVPIVPIALDGTRAAVAKNAWTIRPTTARVRALRPIATDGYGDDRKRLAEDVRRLLAAEISTGER